MAKITITIGIEGEDLEVRAKPGHAITIGTSTPTEPIVEDKKETKVIKDDEHLTIDQKCILLGAMVNEIAGGDETKIKILLKGYGSFEKDGEVINGFTSVQKYKDYSYKKNAKWLNATIARAKQEYIDIFSEQQYEDLKSNL